ncbi:MAG: copper amine oxidase N-terminal domain-containing protein [Bacillota bacterium]|nr:copper amine oxidase N-terminal domain-containing protein [Bacillota bacterium]
MKRLIKLAAAVLIVLTAAVPVIPAYAAQDNIEVYFDGQPVIFDVQPVIENGRTLVPMRAIFETFGADVEWNGETRTVHAETGWFYHIELQIGSTTARTYYTLFNEKGEPYQGEVTTYKLDAPAKILNSRTMVPLRFIAESMNYTVKWDPVGRDVYIYSYYVPEETETGYLSYINSPLSEVVNDLGPFDGCEYFEGGMGFYYNNLDIIFFTDYYGVIDYGMDVRTVMAVGDTPAEEKLAGRMTYPEIAEAMSGKAVISEPQYSYNEMNGVWEYYLEFGYKGYSFIYIWPDNPYSCDSYYLMVKKYQ